MKQAVFFQRPSAGESVSSWIIGFQWSWFINEELDHDLSHIESIAAVNQIVIIIFIIPILIFVFLIFVLFKIQPIFLDWLCFETFGNMILHSVRKVISDSAVLLFPYFFV